MSIAVKNKQTTSTSTNAAFTRAAVKTKQKPVPKNTKLKRESGSMFFQGRVCEAIADPDTGELLGNRFRVTLIREGLGNFGDAFYYTPTAILSMVPLFEGAQGRANHPTKVQEEEQPEGNVLTVFGYYENCEGEIAGDGCMELNADLVIIPGPAFDRERGLMVESVNYAKKHPDKSLIGLSINAGGDFETDTMEHFMMSEPIPPGAQAKLTEALNLGLTTIHPVRLMTMAESCDLVTTAGAGGRVNAILESQKEKETMKTPKQIKEAAEKKRLEAAAAKLREDGVAGAGATGQGGQDGDEDGEGGGDEPGGDEPGGDDDQELLLQMLKKYCGDGFTDDQKQMAKEAYETATEAGLEPKEAMQAAGYSMKLALHKMAKDAASGGAATASPGTQEDEGADPVSPPAPGKKQPPTQTQSAKGGKGKDDEVIKLTATVASLQARLDSKELKEHMDSVMKESKLPMSATKKFRECITAKDGKLTVKSTKEFNEKFNLFREAFGMSGEARSSFILEAEKTVTGSEAQGDGPDYSDCVEN